MPKLDASTASCIVLTFKHGLLSPVAHDLKLRADRLELDISEDRKSVTARMEARALRVVCAMKDGREALSALSTKDIADIEDNITRSVFDPRRPQDIRFISSSVEPSSFGFVVRGQLSVQGRTQTVCVEVRKQSGKLAAEFSLHQPDFGIKPYSAMLGTLRVKPDVTVRIELSFELD